MGFISSYLKNSLLNEAIGGAAFSPASNLEVRLFSTTLNAAGTGTEITNGGYAAQTVANNLTTFPTTTTGMKTNAIAVEFDAATEDWADVLAVGIFDAADNLYFYDNLTVPLENLNTYQIIFDVDSLSFVLA